MSTVETTRQNPVLCTVGLGNTLRKDSWWVEPTLIIVALLLFTMYATWSILQGNQHLHWGPYTSPFYPPSFMGKDFSWLPVWASPALFIAWIPLGFRATCYYYRRAYYRAIAFDPPACAVGESRHKNYTGETKAPLLWQNMHRYFFYLAFVLMVFHWVESLSAFWYQGQFHLGLGNLVLLLDAVLLTGYVCSCHAWRHLIGGKLDCFSCSKANQVRHGIWQRVSHLNESHAFWAWSSMFTVAIADLYVRLCAMGVLQDIRWI